MLIHFTIHDLDSLVNNYWSLFCGFVAACHVVLQKIISKETFTINGVVLQNFFVAIRVTASMINIDKYIMHIHP